MISLHIAKWLEDEGFGTIDQDIFWEEVPLDPNGKPYDGIWVVTRGSALNRFNTTTQQFDIYSRYANKITGSLKLEQILEKIMEAYGDVCTLPTVPPYSLTNYGNVRLRPVSGIENVGSDAQDKIVRVISAEVQYNIQGEN
jgi:hypothetical protein